MRLREPTPRPLDYKSLANRFRGVSGWFKDVRNMTRSKGNRLRVAAVGFVTPVTPLAKSDARQMPKALTVRSVESAKPDPNRRLEIPDAILPGLYLILQPSGARSYAVRFRSPVTGKPAKLTLGRHPALGLSDARAAAGKALRDIAEGQDPTLQKADARRRSADRSDTIAAMLDEFVERHVKVRNRPSTARETQRLIERELKPTWGARKVDSIQRRDIIRLLDAVADRGAPILANRVLALQRVFLNFLVSRGEIAVSPAAGVKAPTAEKSRDPRPYGPGDRLALEGDLRRVVPVGPFRPYSASDGCAPRGTRRDAMGRAPPRR